MLFVSNINKDRVTVTDTVDGVLDEASSKIVKAISSIVGVNSTGGITVVSNEDIVQILLTADTLFQKQCKLNIDGTRIIDSRREPYVEQDGTITYGAPVSDNNLEFVDVKIPYGIETIGVEAFRDCRNLKSVEIPNSVEVIDKSAFCDCSSLVEIDIPDSVDVIDRCAFFRCTYLSTVHLPKKVSQIGHYAFAETALEAIEFPDVTVIPVRVCSELGQLRRVVMNKAEVIEHGAFFTCRRLAEVQFSDNLECIGENAFGFCEKITNIELPNTLRMIKKGAFDSCIRLKAVKLPDEMELIDDMAFRGCRALRQINIPRGIKKIAKYCFSSCESLEVVHLPDTVQYIASDAFRGCKNLREINIPDSVQRIESGVFCGCASLKEIHIPEGVKEIPVSCFECCTSLKEIRLPDTLEIIDRRAFNSSHLTLIYKKGTVTAFAVRLLQAQLKSTNIQYVCI